MTSSSFEIIWDEYIYSFGLDERVLFVLGTWFIHLLTFWSLNVFFFLIFRLGLFKEKRILGDQRPSEDLVWRTIRHCLFNHLIVQPIVIYFAYPGFTYFGMKIFSPLPSISTILRDFAISVAINDTVFYWSHRLLHHKSIYKYIHKQHHQYNVSIGIAAEYAHPLEDIVSNILPTIGGCLILGSHAFTLWLWLFLRILETVWNHSGYSFDLSPTKFVPFMSGEERHDFHHSHNAGCYGSFFTFWDSVMDTDKEFLQHKQLKASKKNT